MTLAASAPPGTAETQTSAGYQPGVCNIGPAEIARRRRAGHTGLIATIAAFIVLIVIGAPDWTRFLVAIPAVGAAAGYLQAGLKFCAGFGAAGVFNFGRLGPTEQVQSMEDRRRDRARALQIGAASVVIGIAAGLIAVAIPI
jgi:hypothetical protein